MKKLTDIYDNVAPVRDGDLVEGAVIKEEGPFVFVDLGIKGTGIALKKEIRGIGSKANSSLAAGNMVYKVRNAEGEHGYVELSFRDAQEDVLWKELGEKKEKGEFIKVKIVGNNKGGLLAKVDGIDAFLPASQLSRSNYPKVEDGDPKKIFQELQKFIGTTIEAAVFSFDKDQRQIILSEKAKDVERKKKLLRQFNEGDIVSGNISVICSFGAFMEFLATEPTAAAAGTAAKTDIAGKDDATENEDGEGSNMIEGLIHVSELSWQMVHNPSEVVKVGDKVKAKILHIRDGKVFLSLKAMEENPWQKIGDDFKKGDVIKGKIVKISSFGSLVEIKPKVQALCHISEFGSPREMEAVLKIGDTHTFSVLFVSPEEHKILLGWQKQ